MADEENDIIVGDDEMLADCADIEPIEVTAEEEAERKNNPLNTLLKHHPECKLDYAESIAPKLPLIASPPLKKDPNHRSVPFLTQYERTKIIGLRANQLSQGARPYITIPEYVTDVGEIARMELAERRLPFLVVRPMPDGTHEYWRLSDLLILS